MWDQTRLTVASKKDSEKSVSILVSGLLGKPGACALWKPHICVSAFRCAAPRGQEPRWPADREPTRGLPPAPVCRDPG